MKRIFLFLFIFSIIKNPTFAESLNNFKAEYNLETSTKTNASGEISATITGGASVCVNGANPTITFTGSGSTSPYTFTYQINSDPEKTVSTSAGINNTTVSAPTDVAGNFIYKLISVSDGTTTQTVDKTITVTVNMLPTVDFSFTDHQCLGSGIQFTSSVNEPCTYAWNFGDGSTSTETNPTHTFSASGGGTKTFIVSLTVTSSGTGCTQSVSKQISLEQTPDPSINSDVESATFNGQSVFKKCSSSDATITFSNESATLANNASYKINWGDGTPDFTATTWDLTSHTYALGFWTMTYTITGSYGCVATRTYKVFVGSNPAGTLIPPGNTDICGDNTITFPISGTENNPPGTTYTITFSDDPASPVTFIHPAPASVTHTFKTSSCGFMTPDGMTNSFYAKLVSSNPCGTTAGLVEPIYVSTPPKPSFTISTDTTCTNTSVCLTSTSTGSVEITNNGTSSSCETAMKTIWKITPATGFTLASGSLGNDHGSTAQSLWTTGTTSICPVFSVPGSYTITMKAANRCGGGEKDTIICVEAPLVPNFTLNTSEGCAPLSVQTTNTTDLSKTCKTPAYLWEVTYTAANCGTTSAYTFTSGTNQSSGSPSLQFSNPGTYTLKLTATNTCGSESITKTIIVKKAPTVNINSISDYCGSATINPTAIIENCAPTNSGMTYAWSFPGGLPATANTENPGSIEYKTPGNYTVTLTVTNECGIPVTATKSFNVNVVPAITNASLAQTICSGHQTDLITLTANPADAAFSWTATATPEISGFITSGATNTIPAQTIYTTSTSPGTITYAITPKRGDCEGETKHYVITVNPAPYISEHPVSSSVCKDGIATALKVTCTNGVDPIAYQWYSNLNNGNTGGTLITGATSNTYNPSTSSVGTTYYYCVISPSGSCSEMVSNPASVTVNSKPTIQNQPTSTQDICIGGTIASPLTATYSEGAGAASYQWYQNSTSSNVGGTQISGATTASYTPSPFSTAGTYYYYAEISLSGNNCGSILSNVAEIKVVPDPVITEQPTATQTLCQSSTATSLTVIATGGVATSYSYQWYQNSTANTSTGTIITGANNQTYTPSTSNVGTFYYYCLITQPSGSGCSVTSDPAEVIVKLAPTITEQPTSSTVCEGGSANTLSVSYANGVGSPTYQWYSNSNNSNIGGIAITNATNSTYTPPTTTVGTTYYYCMITLSSGGCSEIISNPASVTVNAVPVIQTQPTPLQSICVGGSIATPITASYSGGTGTATYQWYQNSTSSTTDGTPIAGATNPSYTPSVFSTVGTYYYYVKITLSGNNCGSILSNAAQINVVADPVVTTQPIQTQTLCQGSAASNLSVTATGGIGDYAYQWYQNVTNNTTTGTAISGANNQTYTPSTSNVGTLYYYCLITQPDGLGCNVTSDASEVIVKLAPTITNQPISSDVCENGTPNTLSVVYANGVGTPTYQWYSNSNNSNIGGIEILNATNATYTPPTTTAGTTYYYCRITLSSGGCSEMISNPATVIVNPLPVIQTQPKSLQSVCVGGTITAPLTASYSGGTGTATYQWYSNTTNSTATGTPVSGATNSSYTPPPFSTVGTYYYYVKITLSGNNCGSIFSDPAQIDVVADPVVTAQPVQEQTLCQNAAPENLAIEATGGIGTYAYQWYQNSVNNTTTGTIILGATDKTYTPSTANIGTTYYYCMVSQPDGPGCNVTSELAKVTVNAAPTIVTQPMSSSVCLKETPSVLNVAYINGAGIPQYQWYSNTTNSITGSTSILNANTSSYNPPASVVGTMYYYCVITLPTGGCSTLVSDIAQVTINQYPIVSSFNSHIGSGTSFTVEPVNTGTDIVPAGTTYTWSLPTISPANSITGASAQSNAQTSISQLLTNTTKAIATATYTVTPLSGSCAGDNFNVVVTVDPPISSNATVKNISCFGANNGSIQTDIQGGNPPYVISWSGPNMFTSNQPDIFDLVPGDYNLKITDNGGLPFSLNYTVSEPADIVLKTDLVENISCFSAANGKIDISVSGGTTPYQYTWTKDGSAFATTEDISNLSPGNYAVSVTDANSCNPKTLSFTITEPAPLVVTLVNQTNLLCYGDSVGTISMNVEGGTPIEKSAGVFDYNYSWSGPNGYTSTNKNISNLVAGTYTLTATDNNGCTQSLPVTITQPDDIIIKTTVTPVTCFGANNATIKLDISGGVEPYQIQWSNFAKGTFLDNLAPGIYTVTVIDANSCQKTIDIEILEAEFYIRPTTKDVSCFGAHNGSISLNIHGGIAPISLIWADNATAGSTRNNLAPGTYTATLTDASSCTFTRTFEIIEPLELKLSSNITNAFDCDNANSGAISLVVSGGTQPYSYAWSNGAMTKDLSNIPGGTYVVTITDANGCTLSEKFEVIRPLPLALTVNIVPDYNCATKVIRETCTAKATGGVPPYQYTWSSGTASGTNNEIMETTQKGLIILGVTDGLGCTKSYTFDLQIPDQGIDAQIKNCDAHIYGFKALIPIGQPSDYTYFWNFGDGKTETAQNPEHTFSEVGTYNVSLTIKNSTCTSVYEKYITVEAAPVLVLDKLPVFCTGESILLHVSGADTYRWNNNSTADSLRITQVGDYSVTGTSKAGCTSTLSFKATTFEPYNYTIQSDKDEITTDNPSVQLWSESITYSDYFWDFGDGKSAQGNNQEHYFDNLRGGYYEVKLKVVNPNGCNEYATKKIWTTNTSTNNVFTPNGDGIDDVFMEGWHVKVYNRNGVLLYDGTSGWNGTYKGNAVSNDTYFYILYNSTVSGIKTSTGFITVIR